MNFHHIGIATNDIEKCLSFVNDNFEVIASTNTIYDPNQNAELVLITTKSVVLELVSGPLVSEFIKKQQTYYHICYEVDDLDKSIAEFQQSIVISKPTKAILFNNRRVAFIMTPIGIIELLESREQLDENRVG